MKKGKKANEVKNQNATPNCKSAHTMRDPKRCSTNPPTTLPKILLYTTERPRKTTKGTTNYALKSISKAAV
jgi:hypothetical protein